MAAISIFLCLIIFEHGLALRNLLQNPDMESTDFSGNWVCQGGCNMQSSLDSYHGRRSVKISNRHHDWEGPSQNVQVTARSHYNFTAYVKLLNTVSGHLYQAAEAMMTCQDNHGKSQYLNFGNSPYIQPNIWTEVGGIKKIPYGYHNCHIYMQVHGSGVDYVFDRAVFQLVPNNAQWKTDAQARIEHLRKAPITIRFADGTHLPSNVQIEITQTKHEFAFGSCVGASHIVNPAYKKYQDFFYDNFEWAVLENALKWQQMEPRRGHVNYNTALNAVNALRTKGIKVRGHNVFWAVDQWVPGWVKTLSKQDLIQEKSSRIKGVISHTKGLLEHWDVNNEDLHGDFFEQHTGNPNVTMQMFRDIHAVDPNVKLFLNDYAIMTMEGDNKATALSSQAKLFKAAKVPIYGVGIQSHVYNAHLDITLLKARLDKVAEAGLPIWITELTLSEKDENLKGNGVTSWADLEGGRGSSGKSQVTLGLLKNSASGLEDLLTLYFSHPAVEGVLLWGFWDGILWLDDSKLAEGPNVTPNAAGRAYQKLFKETWRTHITRNVLNTSPIHLRGFKGSYTIKVKQNGHVIESEQFILGTRGKILNIHLDQHGGQANVIVG